MEARDELKVCSKCGESWPLDHFRVFQRQGRPRRHSHCRACQNARLREYRRKHPEREAARSRRYRQRNPDKVRARNIAKRGATLEDYDVILARQGGVCAICKTPPPEGKHLSVDHCHATGVVRGLLCGKCNSGLGMFADDPGRLIAAVTYLKETKQ